jgi:hypothetical protein
MTNQKTTRSKTVVVPRPERVRHPGREGFGWLDARLHKQGWLAQLTPDDLAAYTFLCLVANQQGVSWYRRDSIRECLGIDENALWVALRNLDELDLVAYRPFGRHASEGFRQVLSLPPQGPPEGILMP